MNVDWRILLLIAHGSSWLSSRSAPYDEPGKKLVVVHVPGSGRCIVHVKAGACTRDETGIEAGSQLLQTYNRLHLSLINTYWNPLYDSAGMSIPPPPRRGGE